MSDNELKALLRLSRNAVEIYTSSQKGSEGKDELAKSPIFQHLAKLVANYI